MRSTALPAPLRFLAILVTGCFLAVVIGTLQVSLTLGATLGLGFLLLFLARPEVGLLFVLLARASSDAIFGLSTVTSAGGEIIGGLPNIGLILILTFAGGVYILSRSVPLINLPGGRLLSLLLLTGLIGVLRSDSTFFAIRQWVPVLATFVLYALAAHLFAGLGQIQRAVDVIGVSFILPATVGLYQLISGTGMLRLEWAVARGVTGTFLHSNSFGFFLVLIIALFLGQALFQTGRRRTVAVMGLSVALALVVGTYSRVAWAGALVVLFVVAILRARFLLLLAPLGVATVYRLVPNIGARLADPLEGSFGDRLFRVWPETLDRWRWATTVEGGGFLGVVNRLAGLGPGVGTSALGRYRLEGIPHNDYLRVLVEYGIFGLILYFALIVVLAVMAFRTWREFRETNQTVAAVALSFFALTLAFPVMSVTDNIFAQSVNQVYFWTLAGLTVAVRKWGLQHPKNESRLPATTSG